MYKLVGADMGKIRHELWTFCKAEASASAASVVDFGLAISLSQTGLLPYAYANMVGVVSGGLANFTLNSRYVFSHTGRRVRSLAMRYLMVWTGSMILNCGVTNTVTWLLGTQWFVAVKCLVALCVAFGFNYPLQRTFVFSEKKGEPDNSI